MMFSPTMSTPPLEQSSSRFRPFVEIIEQPFQYLRYRYLCEGRPGTIYGASSTPERKFPLAIQIVGYQGRVVVVVSCVTKDQPYRCHPHNLVVEKGQGGVCSFEAHVTSENPVITLEKLAVQCVKKKDVQASLSVRKAKNVDPFLKGFGHSKDIKLINLNVMRLCFQVFLKNGSKSVGLTPVVSNPIYNKKIPDPEIHRLSHCNSYVNGRTEDIILLCTKVDKEDIQIRFFEVQNYETVWEAYGTFNRNHIYNSTAICFRPPEYRNQNITEPVKVFVQLVRTTDGFKSRAVEFEYLPLAPNWKKYQQSNALLAQLLGSASTSTSTNQDSFFGQSPETHQIYQPTEERRTLQMDENSWILRQAAPLWPQGSEVPLTVNNQDEQSISRRNTQGELSDGNINSEDFSVDSSVNLESAVLEILKIASNQSELKSIHVSSGDFEMTEEVNRLSGSLKQLVV